MANFIQIGLVNKIAPELNINKFTLYKWEKDGRYPVMFTRIGGKVLVELDTLRKLLKSGE